MTYLTRTLCVLGALLLFGLVGAPKAHADQISCVADGKGVDTCDVTFPNVLAAQTTYPDLVFRKGDTVTISATGCAQTGGSGSTWKRYLDPEGSDSDHLYHGLISIAGVTNGLVRIQSVAGKALPAAKGGPLTLGYEDNQFDDNGYWSHDDGNDNQCQNQSIFNNGRAAVHLVIHHHTGPFAAAGTRSGMCHSTGMNSEACHIDRPDVTHPTETYSAIAFAPGDSVVVTAGGCVQTGGSGSTWKRYVNPDASNAPTLYFGLVSIPGTTSGLVKLRDVVGKHEGVFQAGALQLGYVDNQLDDNGYWKHDDGTNDQCKNLGAAFLDINITHLGAHVTLDGMEVTQAIQTVSNSVPLVADKRTFVRAYVTGVELNGTISGVLTVTRAGASPVTVNASDQLNLQNMPSSLIARRQTLGGSLNFLLPTGVTADGNTSFALAVNDISTNKALPCDDCATSVHFGTVPPLRVRAIGLSYQGGTPSHVQTPRPIDFALFDSWVGRAYPVAQVDASQVIISASSKWPFSCDDANSQISALRGNDVSNGGVDGRTHYIALVSTGGGFMRGCASGIPDSPDPSTVAAAPTGPTSGAPVPINVTGDSDGSFGDWYGGHELGHTFGRYHPGFCNGNSHDDSSFPYPNGQISDNAGDDTGFDVGDAAQAEPIVVLPGASRFDIMTYCNQPQWLSAYTYEGVRTRLIAEGALGSGGGAGEGGAAGPAPMAMAATPGSFIHVVAVVDLTAGTAQIRYVHPTRAALADLTNGDKAELRLLTAAGQLIQSVPATLRADTDTPPGEHQMALIDAYVPASAALARIQVVLGGQVKDEFHAAPGAPPAPAALTVAPVSEQAVEALGWQRYVLRWRAAPPAAGVTYTVEGSQDGRTWLTLGIGLTTPSLTVAEANASPFLRVIATNGLTASAPVMIRGLGVAAPVVREPEIREPLVKAPAAG